MTCPIEGREECTDMSGCGLGCVRMEEIDGQEALFDEDDES